MSAPETARLCQHVGVPAPSFITSIISQPRTAGGALSDHAFKATMGACRDWSDNGWLSYIATRYHIHPTVETLPRP